MVESDNKTLKH